MARYREKPPTVEAFQVTPDTAFVFAWPQWAQNAWHNTAWGSETPPTQRLNDMAAKGTWVVSLPHGVVTMSDEYFRLTYEAEA